MADKITGVILVNLGSPATPTRRGVKLFLREFLSDPRVVEIPRLFWWVVLNGFVIPLRSKRVSEAYQAIWLPEGSPLTVYTQMLAENVKTAVESAGQDKTMSITWAMTYGGPSISKRVREFSSTGVDAILIIPLFPQYSGTTTGAVYDLVASLIKSQREVSNFRIVKDYHCDPAYIEALACRVKEHWEENGRNEKLLMSFHGLPIKCVKNGDPYAKQCENTAKALAEFLNLDRDEWDISYQSRFGRERWLQPYTNDMLESWAKKGVLSVDVICPAFASDCLETLEEIGKECRELFFAAGGSNFSLIPCLNAHPAHVKMIENLIRQNIYKSVGKATFL